MLVYGVLNVCWGWREWVGRSLSGIICVLSVGYIWFHVRGTGYSMRGLRLLGFAETLERGDTYSSGTFPGFMRELF